jgi:hypothetical protein
MSCIADTPCGGDPQQEQEVEQQEPVVPQEQAPQDGEMNMSSSSNSSPNANNSNNNGIAPCSSHSDCHNQFCSNSNGGYEGTCVDCLFNSNIGCRAAEECVISPTTGVAHCQDRSIAIQSHDEAVDVPEEEYDGLQTAPLPPQPQYQNPQDNSFFCGLTFADVTAMCLNSKPCPTGIAALDCGPKEGCFSHPTCKLQYDSAAATSSQSSSGGSTMSAFAAFDTTETETKTFSQEGEQGGESPPVEGIGDGLRFWTAESWNSPRTSLSSKVSSFTVATSVVLLMLL